MTAHETLTSPHPARLTSRDFLLLAESGAFDQYAKAELIEGEIFVVNAQYRRHARVRGQIKRLFEDALAERNDGLAVLDECSVAFDDSSIPAPDVVLTTEPDGEGPIPIASVRLIVEVADTTLSQDLGRERSLYARNGVPEYWVFDLTGACVMRMWEPKGDDFARYENLALGERVESATIAGVRLETSGLK